MTIKNILKKLPFAVHLWHGIKDCWTNKRRIRDRNLINARIHKKRQNGEKINVVFVCHRPAVWESLHSVYDSLKANDRFNVTILAIPNKKELPDVWLNHEVYESEGAEIFWKDYGCINGYNYQTKEWFDLKTLKPDYVFFQQPYNITRPKEYKSWVVAKYANICYVSYFAPCEYGPLYDECLPEDFLKCVSLFFSQNPVDHEFVTNRIKQINDKLTIVALTGYPKYDYTKEYSKDNSVLKEKTGLFKIVWTPRWTTNEGLCNFFHYKDDFSAFCKANMDIDFTFRPHPQAFSEWNSTGEFSEQNVELLKQSYARQINMHLDQTDNYYPLLYSSDCLITDMSSIVFDYLFTGKPIILCMDKSFTGFYLDISEGLYRASSWEEIEDTVLRLKSGDDPLKVVRQRIVTEIKCISNDSAGKRIMHILEEA